MLFKTYRKDAIYRRMKHYRRESDRSRTKIAELEQRRSTCEAGLAALLAGLAYAKRQEKGYVSKKYDMKWIGEWQWPKRHTSKVEKTGAVAVPRPPHRKH